MENLWTPRQSLAVLKTILDYVLNFFFLLYWELRNNILPAQERERIGKAIVSKELIDDPNC